MKGGNPKGAFWDDVVTYCDLESLLKYTYIIQYSKVPTIYFNLNASISIFHSICPCLRHRPKMLLLDFCPSYIN